MYASEKEFDKESQTFVFTGKQDFSETGYKNVKSIKFVFDNFDDAVKAGETIKERWNAWWTEGSALSKWATDFVVNNGGSSVR